MQAKAQKGSDPSVYATIILLTYFKCDEARPICTRCSKSRRQCSYEYESGTGLIFRNFAAKLSLQIEPPLDDRRNSILTAATHPAIAHVVTVSDDSFIDPTFDKDVLLEDFLRGFCIKSKDHSLSRGYLDGLPRLLEHGNTNINVSKAANAAALGFAGMRYQRKDLLVEAERAYASLLRSFRKAIVEVEDSTRLDTFMTTVLLGLYEIVTATDTSPGAQNIHLHGLSAILIAAGPPLDLLGGIRVFLSANALPAKAPAPSVISFATMLEPNAPRPVQNLDVTMSKLQPVLSQSDEMLSSSFQNIEALYPFFDQVSEAGRELDTWSSRQVNEWQPHKLLHSTPDRCCMGKLELRPGRIETYYDVYVASVWNTYRKCHILILDLQWRCAKKLQGMLAGNSKTSTEEQVRMQSKANELSQGLLSSVAYHLTNLSALPDPTSAGTDETSRKLGEIGKPVGGLLLMHPMYVVTQVSIIDDEMRRYARRTLKWIAREMGIGEAAVLANEQSSIPFQYAAKGHVLVWAGMLIQSPFVCSGLRAGR